MSRQTEVFGLQMVHHTDPSVWPDPHSFKPERWLIDDEAKLKEMKRFYYPFSFGAHPCIGRQ